jgi:hypothetical protein
MPAGVKMIGFPRTDELPSIRGRELNNALHIRLCDRTISGASKQMVPRQIRVDQPVRRNEAACAESHSNSRRATMSIVDRISGGRRLRGGYSEYISHVLAIGKCYRRAGEHDEGLGTSGQRHEDLQIAKQSIGTAHDAPHVRAKYQWECF